MTLIGQRAAIAMAVATVPGCRGHNHRPVVPNVGDVWVLNGGGERDAGTAFMNTWIVRVFGPQDEPSAEQWWDDHWNALFFALDQNVGFVVRWTPIMINIQGGGDQYGWDITMTAEE